jgi:A/G-specific adenine glycosylase
VPPSLTTALLGWSADHGRDLPWRGTRDPWAVLVSEVMLQQTQVARVEPKFRAFLDRFPTPAACASVALGEVLRLWHGLGYPRRAVRLHAAACMITHDLGGVFPSTLEGLRALPGVGGYTARAILAFAFEADAGVVDTNAARVLARLEGRRLTTSEVQDAADALVPQGEAWAWNQAMLDLGATICTARSPACEQCPVVMWCGWDRRGPDPAVGSAGVSTRQARFAGSDREARGRLMATLNHGPLWRQDVPTAAGLPDDEPRARRLIASLVADGLAISDGDWYRLP